MELGWTGGHWNWVRGSWDQAGDTGMGLKGTGRHWDWAGGDWEALGPGWGWDWEALGPGSGDWGALGGIGGRFGRHWERSGRYWGVTGKDWEVSGACWKELEVQEYWKGPEGVLGRTGKGFGGTGGTGRNHGITGKESGKDWVLLGGMGRNLERHKERSGV